MKTCVSSCLPHEAERYPKEIRFSSCLPMLTDSFYNFSQTLSNLSLDFLCEFLCIYKTFSSVKLHEMQYEKI